MEQGDKAHAEQCLEDIRAVSKEIVGWLEQLYTRVTTSPTQQAA